MAIRILIADDHEAVRLGLRAIFEETEFEVVAEAASGKEAFQLALEHQPDVALLDVRMPNGDGLSCLARLKLDLPDTRVVMFSAYDNPTFIARAVALGAAGYLMKDISQKELLQCLRVAATGETIWPRSKLQNITRVLVAPQTNVDAEVALTKREREVLKQMAYGLTNREIAQSLEISYETVKEHVQHILQKIGVADRTQAAVWAVRQNLV
jgi:DNA-binding NarL/FixJ family response regulator